MDQKEIINMAKEEINQVNELGIIYLPNTETQVKEINKGIPLKAYGLRTYSKRYRRSYNYLICVAHQGTWKEIFNKIPL